MGAKTRSARCIVLGATTKTLNKYTCTYGNNSKGQRSRSSLSTFIRLMLRSKTHYSAK